MGINVQSSLIFVTICLFYHFYPKVFQKIADNKKVSFCIN